MKISARKKREIYNKTNGHCAYCGSDLESGWHVDHVVPKAHGGTNSIDNLLPSCPQCNRRKHNRDPEDFRLWIFNDLADQLDKTIKERLSWTKEKGFVGTERAANIEASCLQLTATLAFAGDITFFYEDAGISVPEWEAYINEWE